MVRQKCKSQERLSKKTLIAMLPEGSRQREWFESLTDNQWEITSFDSRTREVCIDVSTNSGTNHLSVIIPYLSKISTDSV